MIAVRGWIIILGSLVVALVAPHFLPPGFSDWLTRLSTLILVAASWNMMANAGLISLGHSGFWGLGAYSAALLANAFHIPFWLSIVPAMLLGAFFGACLAYITGRLRGLFFAIATLATSEALRVVALMVPKLTGGAEGVFVFDQIRPDRITMTSFSLCLAVATVATSYFLSRSRYQYALRAMRDSESAVQMLGVNPARFRIGVTALSGAIASCAGVITAWFTGYIDPGSAFDLKITISAQIAPLFGGLYTVTGPVVGSIAILALSELTRLYFNYSGGVGLLVYGCILVFGVLMMPSGLVGLWKRRRKPVVTDAAVPARAK
ncbi:branched-chain amino acid ABC transporter permease [Bradyrhizobium sp. dw_411]|uniref:branched-chain amino acid ABC transporter permease n=1 Tax=Bradyrhizobium sp. dw_411 TaxID=2720082 RepID=UPI001BCCA602|nr:branched-chain amino acid ABC transporter permease [Bradyrhizobium sp. dw_411]